MKFDSMLNDDCPRMNENNKSGLIKIQYKSTLKHFKRKQI